MISHCGGDLCCVVESYRLGCNLFGSFSQEVNDSCVMTMFLVSSELTSKSNSSRTCSLSMFSLVCSCVMLVLSQLVKL